MIHIRPLVVVLLVAVALTPPVGAAVTATRPSRGGATAGWLDRYSTARQGTEQTDRVSQTIKVGERAALDLSNVSGDVHVTGGSGTEIRVEAVKRVRHRDPDTAKRLLEELRVEITNVGGRVEVRTIHPRRQSQNRGQSASVDYTVSVPRGAMVAVKTISGDVMVADVTGEVRAETVSGDVTVQATPNVAVAKTVSGDVTARGIEGASALSLGTVSGSVIADGLKARTLECGTVSGDLQLTGVEVERLTAKSVSGDIEFGATLARGGRYEFNSHSGDVRISLTDATGFELDATTFNGSVRSDFPVTLRADGGSGRSKAGSTRAIRGSFGDASALLTVQTFSGTIVLTRK
jgi:DUF4097 and DUF4098 domain-containing protein YvlB